jgi:hypothetical protein
LTGHQRKLITMINRNIGPRLVTLSGRVPTTGTRSPLQTGFRVIRAANAMERDHFPDSHQSPSQVNPISALPESPISVISSLLWQVQHQYQPIGITIGSQQRPSCTPCDVISDCCSGPFMVILCSATNQVCYRTLSISNSPLSNKFP